MPSSKDRRRIEVPTYFYDRLKQIADSEDRTIAGVLHELLQLGLANYHPTWMPGFFMERFDQSARRTLELAQEEAALLGHHYVGTEHLLLGLLREETGVAGVVLRRLWLNLDKTRAAVVHIVDKKLPAAGVLAPSATGAAGDYAPRVRTVLALAVDEAQRLGHDYVGTEHLLLAVVREGEGIAAGLLQLYGALGKVRDFTMAALEERHGAVSGGVDEAGVTDVPELNSAGNRGQSA